MMKLKWTSTSVLSAAVAAVAVLTAGAPTAMAQAKTDNAQAGFARLTDQVETVDPVEEAVEDLVEDLVEGPIDDPIDDPIEDPVEEAGPTVGDVFQVDTIVASLRWFERGLSDLLLVDPEVEDEPGFVLLTDGKFNEWLGTHSRHFRDRNRERSEAFSDWLFDELGVYDPSTGGGGEGIPPFGRYQMIYPVDPGYRDPRDTRLYGAQGWGIPIAGPIAPVVNWQFNYSTGMPASRLTPLGTVVRPPGR